MFPQQGTPFINQIPPFGQQPQNPYMLAGQQQYGGMYAGQKNDPPLTPVGPYGHGDRGLFNRRAIDGVFSAVMVPMGGILDAIPVFNGGENSGNEFGGEEATFDSLLTGVTAGNLDTFSQQPTTQCADGPTAGLLKFCTWVNPYGHYTGSTREVNMETAGKRWDLCDPRVVNLLNNPIMQQFFGMPSLTPSLQNAVNNEIARRIWEAAVSFRRMTARRVWMGSPANNSGERRDIVGLETHINTNTHVDALMSSICTAANPFIDNFNFNRVDGTVDLVSHMEQAEQYVNFNAEQQGLAPFDAVIVMRPELWEFVSNIWPIRQFQHALTQIALFSGGRVNVDATQALNMRNQLRQSRMLPLNGRIYPVIVDNTMPELNVTTSPKLTAGQFASDIYFIPTRVLGVIDTLFWEYWNHENAQSMAIQRMINGQMTFTSDGGIFRWYVNFKNGCLKLNFSIRPRLRFLTPQIAFRITNVAYVPLSHYRTWDASDPNYFFDGGVTEGEPGDQFYTFWSTTTPVSL